MSLLYPVLAQVLLTLALYALLGSRRIPAVRSRKVRLRDVALSNEAYPEDVRKVANNLANQFESPVLFYVLCAAAIHIGATGTLMTLLAWAFVATRVVHSAIHVTHNRVQQRFIPFFVGLIVLALMWFGVVARLMQA